MQIQREIKKWSQNLINVSAKCNILHKPFLSPFDAGARGFMNKMATKFIIKIFYILMYYKAKEYIINSSIIGSHH